MAKNSTKSAKSSKPSTLKAPKTAPAKAKVAAKAPPPPAVKAKPAPAKASGAASKTGASKITPPKQEKIPEAKPAAAKPSTQPRPLMPPPVARYTPAATNAPQIPAAMQSLIDKNEISELVYRYARGLDRIDETMLRSIFHHEATVDLGPGMFQGGANDFVHWVIGVMNGVRSSHHLIGNILPTMERDVALVESYCHAHFRMDKPTGREDVFIGSRYLDRFERWPTGSAGVWKIMHRKQIIDWVRTEAVSDLFYHQNPDALWSFRTKTDPSYQMAQFPSSQSGNKLPSFLGQRYDSKSVKF